MTGEEDRGAPLAVQIPQEVPHALLRQNIQSDRWLIEEEHFGAVQESGQQLQLHALSQRELAHLYTEQMLYVQHRRQFVQARLEHRLRHAVHLALQQKGLHGGNIPGAHRLLSHDQSDA